MRPEESLLANVKMAPRDAILGLTETYVADPNPKKVNLGVGVYYDDQGNVPLLECVRRADEALTAAGIARPYLAMAGLPRSRRSAAPEASRSGQTSSGASPPRPCCTYPTRATTTTGRCSRRPASGSRPTPITICGPAGSGSPR